MTKSIKKIFAALLVVATLALMIPFSASAARDASIKPGHFDDSQFNDYERHNVDTIVNYMKEKGYR